MADHPIRPIDHAIAPHPEGVVLAVVVAPRSGKTSFDRVEAGAVRIRVAAPPVEGAANVALIRFLAKVAGVPRSRVRIVVGETGRRKRILFEGLGAAELAARLEQAIA